MPAATIPDTWQTMLSYGSQSDTANWTTYRSMYGTPSFSVGDISAYDGRYWYKAEMWMWLVDGGGNVRGSGYLAKYWGQPASMSLGPGLPFQMSVRLRTRVNIWETSYGPGSIGSGTWRGTLYW